MGDTADLLRGPDGPRSFEEVLQSLKSAGCSLLVTGRAPPSASFGITRRLLGSRGDRYRVVALTDHERGTKPLLLPEDRYPDDQVTFIDARYFGERSASGATSPPAPSTGPTRDASSESWPREGRAFVDALSEKLCDAVEEMSSRTDLAAGQLRTALVTLEPLLDRTNPDHVQELCRDVGDVVRRHGGMNHHHLPVPDGSDVVERLAPEFDARIELRRGDGPRSEQRWHVPELDGPTDWMVM